MSTDPLAHVRTQVGLRIAEIRAPSGSLRKLMKLR